MSDPAYKVLCVDDEPRVLEALKRHLRERFQVLTATSGAQGMDLLHEHPDLAVVVSDMRMPEMDGATFLRHTRVLRPAAVRVLLTGQADMAAAIKAINEGQIFRFLTKPCTPEQFLSVLGEAIRQHELVIAERLLLQRTLVGAIKALSDIMALVSPGVVGSAQRLKRRVSALATQGNLEDRWQLEAAALLSNLGHVALPDALTRKLSRGGELDGDESRRLKDATRAANRLIAHVPRLEPVSALLNALGEPDSEGELETVAVPVNPQHVAVLRLAMESERLEAQGLRGDGLVEALQASGDHTPQALEWLKGTQTEYSDSLKRTEVAADALTTGMILDEDIKTTRDVLIVPRGCEVTPSLVEHVRHFTDQLSKPTVAVLQKAAAHEGVSIVPRSRQSK